MSLETVDEAIAKVTAIDVETSSIDNENCEVIEVGYAVKNTTFEYFSEIFKTEHRISPAASAVHGISEEIVEKLSSNSTFIDECSDAYKVKEIMGIGKNTLYVAAHNAKYELDVFSRILPDMTDKVIDRNKAICTWRLARHLIPDDLLTSELDDSLPSYSLNYLYFALGLSNSEYIPSHRAGPDSLKSLCILEVLLQIINNEHDFENSEDLLAYASELSWKPIKVAKFPFGKHKGTPLEQIPDNYLSWAIQNIDVLDEHSPKFDFDLASSVMDEFETRIKNDFDDEIPF